MVLLISGASHTGKTALAQRLLERYGFPYLSIDHLKMGLIRSGQTSLTPEDDEELTDYLWPIVREMIKTAIENRQNLVVEGCYIPFDWQKDLTEEYLGQIRFYCLVMTPAYINSHFRDIKMYGSVIEDRGEDSDLSREGVLRENARFRDLCRAYGWEPVWIDGEYRVDIELPEERGNL